MKCLLRAKLVVTEESEDVLAGLGVRVGVRAQGPGGLHAQSRSRSHRDSRGMAALQEKSGAMDSRAEESFVEVGQLESAGKLEVLAAKTQY